ncbi:hypothetical protein [Nostoc sp.]
MYFNAFLAKTLLAFSGELRVRRDAINRVCIGVRRDAINRVCTGVRSYYFPHAQCPILLYKRLRQRLLYERLRERYFSTRGCANDAAQYKSVQVPHAQCPSLADF